MARAAQGASIGFAGLLAFQAALAAGAPFGHAAWGGAHAELTTGQRVGSAVSILFYAVAIVVVRRRARGRKERRYRWGLWALVALLTLSAVLNAASASRWESLLLAPLALVLAMLCAVVARTAQHRVESPSRRTRAGGGRKLPA